MITVGSMLSGICKHVLHMSAAAGPLAETMRKGLDTRTTDLEGPLGGGIYLSDSCHQALKHCKVRVNG